MLILSTSALCCLNSSGGDLIYNKPYSSENFSVIGEIDIDDEIYEKKMKHILLMPADIFFMKYLDILLPELNLPPVRIIYSGFERKTIYLKVRDIMLDQGIISTSSPSFIFNKSIPRIINRNIMPEMNMSENDIYELIIGSNENLDQMIILLFNNLFSNIYSELEIKGVKMKMPLKEDVINNFSQFEKRTMLSEAFFKFFSFFKNKVSFSKQISDDLLICEDINQASEIGSILKDKYSCKILKNLKEPLSLSQLSKKLNIHPANMSKYLNKLQKLNFVKTDNNGCYKLNVKIVNVNFERML